MIFVIDLIKTYNTAATADCWEKVCQFFSKQSGFISGKLLSTTRTLHPIEDYKLTSVICWNNDSDWKIAKQKVINNTELQAVLHELAGKFIPFKGNLIQGSFYNPAKDSKFDSRNHMILVDVIYLTNDRLQEYAEMWRNAVLYMSKKAGFIGACLHITSDIENKIKYINFAEWESEELFFKALDTTEFIEILKDFKNDFSLYLSQLIKIIEPFTLYKKV